MVKTKSIPNPTSLCSKKTKSNIYLKMILIVIAVVVVEIMVFTQCHVEESQKPKKSQKSNKIFWTHPFESETLEEVNTVIRSLGYEKGTPSSNWDVLWAQSYPFVDFNKELSNLKPHQKVNQIPGTKVISIKGYLALNDLKYIPPAFKLPNDKEKIINYSQNNPNKSFVLKNINHRHIKIVKIDEIDFNENENFVQEFIDKPFLIDGYKFDIGIYTIITSIDPLRIYIYNGDIALRFCPEKYYPFDSQNVDKYVVGENYFPVWKVPALDYYYNKLSFGQKATLIAYLQQHKIDSERIWRQVEDAIVEVIASKEAYIVKTLKKYRSKRNFFELMRFDFIIDENIKVYLLEANMSPNLSAKIHHVNKPFFYNLLYNVLGLVGVGGMFNSKSLARRFKSKENMLIFKKTLMTFPNICHSCLSISNCTEVFECQLCKHCLTDKTLEFLREATREHLHRGDCKRIFPPQMTQQEALKGAKISELTIQNQLQYRWFEGKCIMDKSWC